MQHLKTIYSRCDKLETSTNLNKKKSNRETEWYAIYTRSRFEKKMYRLLLKSNIQAFLPLVKEKRQWSDRLKTVLVPLLPSYVFVKMEMADIHYLYDYPGFVRFVKFAGKLCVIKEEEIALMEQVVTHGFPAQVTTTCRVGERVKIICGPLQGWEGVINKQLGNSRVIFNFDGIQQAIGVEVGLEDVELVK